MNNQKVGELIAYLRMEKGLTQKALADALHISDRTISKWERAAGSPDVSLLPALCSQLGIPVDQLLAGTFDPNQMNNGNLRKTQFYRCPECGNLIYSTGKTVLACCGKVLKPLMIHQDDDTHHPQMEMVEKEYYLSFPHEMSKEHYISFVAVVSSNVIHMVKLYPEQEPATRVPFIPHSDIYYYCTKHGFIKYKKS